MNIITVQIKGVDILIDSEDLSIIENGIWRVTNYGYIRGYTNSVNLDVHLHRHLLNYYGPLLVDHINRNKLDNRKCNLRLCSSSINNHNKTKVIGSLNTQSKYKGVSFRKGRAVWACYITVNSKRYYLGNFNTQEDAARVYDKKALELLGTFAVLNFPDNL